MPTDDVSDLRDVVDAINRLCETMKTSADYGDAEDGSDGACDVALCDNVVDVRVVKVESEAGLENPERVVVSEVETYVAELWSDACSHQLDVADDVPESSARCDVDDATTVTVDTHSTNDSSFVCVVSNQSTRHQTVETVPLNFPRSDDGNVDSLVLESTVTRAEDVQAQATAAQSVIRVESVVSVASGSVGFDQQEQIAATSFEPISEMYYTASSEVSLLSDVELPDRVSEETTEGREILNREPDRNGVMAGHVAAMRERFESMTRANTPCPDVMRSVSPSLDVYRNITPSPDRLA